MNVLFLALDVDLLVPRGDAIHVREQVKFLAERGHRIDLVTATQDGMSGLGSNVHSHTAIGMDLVVVRKCRAIVRAGQAAVVYERRLSPKIAFAVSRLSRIPFVVEVNGVEEEAAMQGRPSTSPLRPLKFRVRKRMYRAAARVVAVTDRLATHTWQLYGLPSEKVVTIPNGVDLATFAPINAAQARRDLGLAGANWVVFVGNLVGWQGVDVLLRAAPRVVREQSDARFLLVGAGVLRPALETLARDLGIQPYVRFVGAVQHELVPIHIGAATVCVAPFTRRRNEGIGVSPLKVYEYLAAGRPVVASAIPGIDDMLVRSGAGRVVEPDNPEALAEALARLLTSPAECAEMGQAARAFAVAECSWARTAASLERVLVEAASWSA